MKKLKVAIFDLTGCEGCQFHLLSLNEYLLDFFQEFEIVNWRLMSEPEKKKADFDLAVIEGAATTDKHIKLLKQIRATSSTVVALGACAVTGNFFAQLTPAQRRQLAPKIYDKKYRLKAKFLAPVEKFIKVDYKIPGCPPDIDAFKKLLADIKQQNLKSVVKDILIPDYTAKIEGHGTLNINFVQTKASFKVEESERLVEGLVLGKNFTQVPVITARICGICPIAHNLASWTAIENALGLQPSYETTVLRKMLACAQIIKSHILHLFFLVLPDYAGVKGGAELAQKYPAEFHLMLNIKRTADKILNLVGGSTAFPTNTALAGFTKVPAYTELAALTNDIGEVLDEAHDIVRLFANLKPADVEVKTKLTSITPEKDSYPYFPGQYNRGIKEIVQTDSTAKLAVLPNGEIMKVGALSRISRFANYLNPKAKQVFDSTGINCQNPLHNNIAQAVEILHFLEEADNLIFRLKDKNLNQALALTQPPINTTVKGQSSLEAPRGVLIHQVAIDPEGKVISYNIIPPTQINLASLAIEAQALLEKYSQRKENEVKKLIEQLIRAFDPCITCAVH